MTADTRSHQHGRQTSHETPVRFPYHGRPFTIGSGNPAEPAVGPHDRRRPAWTILPPAVGPRRTIRNDDRCAPLSCEPWSFSELTDRRSAPASDNALPTSSTPAN